MARSQPNSDGRSNVPCREDGSRALVSSRPLQHANEIEMPESLTSQSTGQYYDARLAEAYERPSPYFGSPYARNQPDAYQPGSHYVEVPRPLRPDLSNLTRVLGDRALEADFSSSHRHTRDQRHSSAQSQYVPVYPNTVVPSSRTRNSIQNVSNGSLVDGQSGRSQVTAARLAEYEGYHQPTTSMATWVRSDHIADPYDAVGYVRRDGEVYDEDELYEYREGYEYDARNDAWR